MAIRTYRDAKSRTRFAVEFQQGGHRVLRRLHPTATKAEAQAFETKLRGEIFRVARLGETPEIGLEEAILQWLENTLAHKKDQKKPVQNAALLAPFVAGKTLRQVPDAAQEATNTWSASGLSTATINRRLCVLKAAAKHAWKRGQIEANLSGRITLLPEHNKREVYLTPAEVRALSKQAGSPACTAAIMFAAYTGLRASELLALTPQDMQRDTVLVRVTKTGRPRNIPIVPLLRPFLSALPLGLSYWQLHKQFSAARAKAKMPHVRFHDLRHSTASMLINAGVPLEVIGEILGHSSMQTTQRYAHLSQQTLKKAMGRLR